MKNSKEYAAKLEKLRKSLKRKHGKQEKPSYANPLDSLVYAFLSECMTAQQADEAFKAFSKHFIDVNDLRVSLTEEVLEAVGKDTPAIRDCSHRLKKALNSIFNEYNTMDLDDVVKLGKKPLRQSLEKFEGIDSYVADYFMLTAFEGHAVPVTDEMISYLKANDAVDPEADRSEIEAFLGRQVQARDAYEFYSLVKKESELPQEQPKEKEVQAEKKPKPASKTKPAKKSQSKAKPAAVEKKSVKKPSQAKEVKKTVKPKTAAKKK